MDTATKIALAGLGLAVVVQVIGWAVLIGKMSARLEELPKLTTRMEQAWKYISQLDRRVAVLEDRDARAEAGD